MARCCARLDDLGEGRAVLRLRGPDTRRFLQGSVSGDLTALGPEQAVTAALLTVKGKIVSELVVLDSGDTHDVVVPRSELDAVVQAFESHIVMDDVVVERADDVEVALVWDDEDLDAHVELEGPVRCVATRHPLPVTMVLGHRDAVAAALADAAPVDAEEFARARIESATPGWGAELRPGFFPPEVGFVYAVGYDKGCYLGQEPLARIHARGQVNRVMVRVVAERPRDHAQRHAGLGRAQQRAQHRALAAHDRQAARAPELRHTRRQRPGVVAPLGRQRRRRGHAGLGDDPGLRKA